MDVDSSTLSPAMVELLLVSWVEALATARLQGEQGWRSQREGRSRTFSSGDDREFALSIRHVPSGGPLQVSVDSVFGVDRVQVVEILAEAEVRTAARQLGATRAYVTELQTKTFDMFTDWMHWDRGIHEYVRIHGARRLGSSALMDFGDLNMPDDADQFAAFVGADSQSIKTTVFVQAPCDGEYAQFVAATTTEMVAAI